MQGRPHSVAPSTSHAGQHAPSTGPRVKRDAGTQVDPHRGRPPVGIAKRVRFADAARVHGNLSELQRVSFETTTPAGLKVVHIDPAGYVARPLDLVTDPWVSEESSRYIRKFLTYSNDDGHWFPVHCVPPDGSWAVIDENPAVMHRVHRGQPLLVWIVGVAVDVYLCSPRDGAAPTLHITFDFLRDLDRAQLTAIHDAAASQPLDPSVSLTVKSPSSEDEGPPSHNAVYDARHSFRRRPAMRDISPGRILSGDIVLVECTVVRTEDGTSIKTVSFVLNSLHWLVEKPRPPSVETRRFDDFPDTISVN